MRYLETSLKLLGAAGGIACCNKLSKMSAAEYVKTYLGVGMEHSINIARCSFNILQGT